MTNLKIPLYLSRDFKLQSRNLECKFLKISLPRNQERPTSLHLISGNRKNKKSSTKKSGKQS